MTEAEMLEMEKHWCENCCNFDKEHSLPDGYANCKVTNMLTFGQTCGKECKFFNVPAENVVVLPCKLGDKVYSIDYMIGDNGLKKHKPYELKVMMVTQKENGILINAKSEDYNRVKPYMDYEIGKLLFVGENAKEEAKKALQATGKL